MTVDWRNPARTRNKRNFSMSVDAADVDELSDADKFFSNYLKYPSCAIVQTMPYANRCELVKSLSECQNRITYVNYLYLFYCSLEPSSDAGQLVNILVLISLLFVACLLVGVVVDRILCPALKVFSKTVGLNEHLTGITLVAFGNSTPDLFSSFKSIDNPRRIILSDKFGASVFITSFVTGFICAWYPFKVETDKLLRDICFFILGVLYVDYAMATDDYVTITESFLILTIYLTYLVVIVVDHYIVIRSLKTLEAKVHDPLTLITADDLESLKLLRTESSIKILSRSSFSHINLDRTRRVTFSPKNTPNYKLFLELWISLNPIDFDEWIEGNALQKMYVISKIPWNFLVLLLVPVVNYELDRHGWSKLLNCLQIAIVPSLIAAVYVQSLLVCSLVLVICVPFAIMLFSTSRTDLSPEHHNFLAVQSILSSITIISVCAGETVEILTVLGLATHVSQSFLAATLTAWGSSVGDLVSSISLARHGYPRMGFAACLGGPFFNSIICIGGTFLYNSLKSRDGRDTVIPTILGETCVIFLLFSLAAMLTWATFLLSNARRSICIFNFGLYFVFLLYVILAETEVIQSYTKL